MKMTLLSLIAYIFLISATTYIHGETNTNVRATFFPSDLFSKKGVEKIAEDLLNSEMEIGYGLTIKNATNKLSLKYDRQWRLEKSVKLTYVSQYSYDLLKLKDEPVFTTKAQLSFQLSRHSSFFLSSYISDLTYITRSVPISVSLGLKVIIR